MWDLIQKGGPLMYLIVLCSIVALAVVIERLYHLHRAKIDSDKFMESISNTVKRNRIMDAVDLCEKTPGPIAHIIKAGILKHDRSRHEVKEAIEDAGIYEVPRLEKNLGTLATIAHISPLLGLLGTVTGMVRAFQVIQEKATSLYPVSPGDLAGGIWEALITTCAGLIVAIPTFVAYNYLVSRVKGVVLEMERTATDLINILGQRNEI
ncbi:MAG: MotA/TolQ/ExbB proton channel family protein [Candidatus Omnitrophica bacterium]|nr:MotA/TolQ/ExbB proton channel family protein [Candidatus Omnitrophota bacterium]MBU4141140.1 MotA/TolQ/ExbB proton channel family protein [Candidatus Omnitrophota bacterium]